MHIIKRKLFNIIKQYVNLKEILVIHGARQVGKTTLIKLLIQDLISNGIQENNIFYLDLEDPFLLELCNKGVEKTVQYIKGKTSSAGKKFVFIDEIQYLNNPSSFFKLFYDHFADDYKLIVSGSSSFEIKKKFTNSLVGRIINFELFPLDFEEFLWFKDKKYDLKSESEELIREISILFEEFLFYGGYPRVVLIDNIEQKNRYLKEIINLYIRKDIRDIGNIRNIDKFNMFIKILSDQIGQLINVDELSNTVGLARDTVYEYLFILENTYVIHRISPFHSNIRSELTKMKKMYFEDTGIANFLRFGQLIEKIDGALFENSVFSLLRKKYDIDNIKFWRTTDKKEIDFIINSSPNPIIGYEVKLHYSGKRISAFSYFEKKYPKAKLNVVSLYGKNALFPWMV